MSFYDEIKATSGAYKFYVNGVWKESASGKTQTVLNPSDNQVVYHTQGAIRDHTLVACRPDSLEAANSTELAQ